MQQKYFKFLVDIYFEYIEKLNSLENNKKQSLANFHGLRDFYFTIKYVCQNIQENNEILFIKEVYTALVRNFGGLEEIKIQNIFEGFADDI
jgi:hypothetical protein